MAVVLFAGCGTPTISRPSQTPGVATVKVSGKCSISVQNDVVTVSGQANLPDGTVVQVAVLGQDGMTIDTYKTTITGGKVSHDFKIADKLELYKKVTSLNGYVYGFITCAPKLYGAQPSAVYQVYGESFQNIDYSDEETKTNYIWDKEGNILVFQSDKVEFKK